MLYVLVYGSKPYDKDFGRRVELPGNSTADGVFGGCTRTIFPIVPLAFWTFITLLKICGKQQPVSMVARPRPTSGLDWYGINCVMVNLTK